MCGIRERNTYDLWTIQRYSGPIDFAICKRNPYDFLRIRTGLVRILEVHFFVEDVLLLVIACSLFGQIIEGQNLDNHTMKTQ